MTPWATIWDKAEQKKFSLHLPDLFCESCICDPDLTRTLSRERTIATSLDALSHALESLWNKSCNPVSTDLAVGASRRVLKILPLLLSDLENVELRSELMLASLEAGLAFSNTKTAVAHAISYFLTARKGISHGIACGFTLPGIVAYASGKKELLDTALTSIFGESPESKIREFYEFLGVSTDFRDYGIDEEDLRVIGESLKKEERAANFLFDTIELFREISATCGAGES